MIPITFVSEWITMKCPVIGNYRLRCQPLDDGGLEWWVECFRGFEGVTMTRRSTGYKESAAEAVMAAAYL